MLDIGNNCLASALEVIVQDFTTAALLIHCQIVAVSPGTMRAARGRGRATGLNSMS